MLVNTGFVVDEISKDRKGGLSGSIGHQFDHDVFFILVYGICLLAMAQIILVFFVVFFVFRNSGGILVFGHPLHRVLWYH